MAYPPLNIIMEVRRNSHDLYCNIQMVFLNGNTIMEHLANEDLEFDDETQAISDLAQVRNWDVHAYTSDWKIFNTILDSIPGLRDCYDKTPDMDLLLKLAKEMNQRANNGRATDAHTLKDAIKLYIPNWIPSAADDHDNKAQRGFNHAQYTKQIIPARYARLFQDDPVSTRAKLLDGRLVVSPRFMPSFVYEKPEDYSSDAVADGLFRGPLLLQVARHVLIGPNVSAIAKVQPGRGGNANKRRITRVTPELVAYLVVQGYFAMNSTTTWNAGSIKGAEAEFDYSILYYMVIKMFSPTLGDEENTWADETLQWMNEWFSLAPSLTETIADFNLSASNHSPTPTTTEGYERALPLPLSSSEAHDEPPIDPVLVEISHGPDVIQVLIIRHMHAEVPVPCPQPGGGIRGATHAPPIMHIPAPNIDHQSFPHAMPVSTAPGSSFPADSLHTTAVIPSTTKHNSERTRQVPASQATIVEHIPAQSHGLTKQYERTAPQEDSCSCGLSTGEDDERRRSDGGGKKIYEAGNSGKEW
ncbi:hypothetical protein HETIRDRAFT_119491 [Heterobasidion irregulare TC 32-1]|uniref:Uncharacterized protein n=1 Tax=Heterobasidion irregulare (strain TC 32-1) TaxID=747525 RepID=W4KA56_HETIT|nr:uncharacterized protein HETIRDRAFT_119491 [Heterobasidion irregulare TC 32-1]ETW82717.1 hypothetical protein HETIRDRAFT_119491 [Heterobasidion irregulare TC 32-1]